MQVFLELLLVLDRNIESQDHWHADADMAAFERIDLRIGLLSQGQVLGAESWSSTL